MVANAAPNATTTPTDDWRALLASYGVSDDVIADCGIIGIDEALDDKRVAFSRDRLARVAVAYPCVVIDGGRVRVVYRVRQAVEPPREGETNPVRNIKVLSPFKTNEDKYDLVLYSWAAGALKTGMTNARGTMYLFEGEKDAWAYMSATGERNASSLLGASCAEKLDPDVFIKLGVTKLIYIPNHDRDNGSRKGAGYKAAWWVRERLGSALTVEIRWLRDAAGERDGYDNADLWKAVGFDSGLYIDSLSNLEEMPADELALYAPAPKAPAHPTVAFNDEGFSSFHGRYVDKVMAALPPEARDRVGNRSRYFEDPISRKPDGMRISYAVDAAHGIPMSRVHEAISWQEVGDAVGVRWEDHKHDERAARVGEKAAANLLDQMGLQSRFSKPTGKPQEAPKNAPKAASNTPIAEASESAKNAPVVPEIVGGLRVLPAAETKPITTTTPVNASASAATLLPRTEGRKRGSWERECALLLEIVGDPGKYEMVRNNVQPFTFMTLANGIIWGIIQKMHLAGMAISFPAILAFAENAKLSEHVNEAYIATMAVHADFSLESALPVAAELVAYEQQDMCELAGHKIIEIANDGTLIPDERAARVQAQIERVTSRQIQQRQSFKDVLRIVAEKGDEIMDDSGALIGISSGFEPLDRLTLGWQKGKSTIIAAETSGGKTAFLAKMAISAAFQGKRVLYNTIEMTPEQVVMRFQQILAPVNFQQLRYGSLTKNPATQAQYREEYARALDQMSQWQYEPVVDSFMRPLDVRAAASKMVAELGGVDLIVCDYLGIMNPDDPKLSGTQAASSISREMKQIAIHYNAHVMSAAQFNRSKIGRPSLRHLKDTSSYEQDADMVIFLYTDLDEDQRITTDKWQMEYIIAKSRDGQTGILTGEFDRPLQKFTITGGVRP